MFSRKYLFFPINYFHDLIDHSFYRLMLWDYIYVCWHIMTYIMTTFRNLFIRSRHVHTSRENFNIFFRYWNMFLRMDAIWTMKNYIGFLLPWIHILCIVIVRVIAIINYLQVKDLDGIIALKSSIYKKLFTLIDK